MAVTLLLGFSSGLPFRLTGDTLQVWMNETGRTLSAIGLFTLVGLPYTLKFLWAPFFDRYTLPFLGRRRGWIVVTQVFTLAAIGGLAVLGPAGSLWLTAAAAVVLSFCSASQDIVLDAHRRDTLRDEELALGSSLFVTGYRAAMLAAGPAALLLSTALPWPVVYLAMAALMTVGIAGALLAPEPAYTPPRTLREAIIAPLADFFSRQGFFPAVLVLLFIVLYKVGDSMASTMTTPFVLQAGYTKEELALAAETLGLFAVICGGMAGGVLTFRLGINRALWIFGVLQAISTAGFMLLADARPDLVRLGAVIVFEKATTGMSSMAFVAYMMRLTNRAFSATQYALLTSMMGVAPKIISAQTGFLAAYLGWGPFFLVCTAAALPGLLLLKFIAPIEEQKG